MEEYKPERYVLFISHALPEDNEFVLWLAAKLRNEGYEVWSEMEQVHGGEHFWREIENVLQTKAVKMILVASQISVQKDGVRAEWDFARELARQHRLKDFIIPLNLDDVSSNAIIGMTSLAMIQFQNSWAHGVKALLRKLVKDNVPKTTQANPLSAAQWYFNRFATTNTVNDQSETFYSNWVALPHLPRTLYLHEYANDVQAKQIIRHIQEDHLFPVARHERYIMAFEKILPDLRLDESAGSLFNSTNIKAVNKINLSVGQIQGRHYKSKEFPTTQDASNFLVQLLQQAFHNFLVQRGLLTYELANGKLCYYFSRPELGDVKVKYNYKGRTRSKQLTGVYYEEDVWHYGISFVARLNPLLAISVKAHILFSNDGKTIWDDKKAIHSARRKKGKRMFNPEWRDLLLAFLSSLSDDQEKINVPIAVQEYLWLAIIPITFISDKGYEDPQDKGRLVPMDDNEEEHWDDEEQIEFDAEAALAELELSRQEVNVLNEDDQTHEEII
jgi:hypothetical protein